MPNTKLDIILAGAGHSGLIDAKLPASLMFRFPDEDFTFTDDIQLLIASVVRTFQSADLNFCGLESPRY